MEEQRKIIQRVLPCLLHDNCIVVRVCLALHTSVSETNSLIPFHTHSLSHTSKVPLSSRLKSITHEELQIMQFRLTNHGGSYTYCTIQGRLLQVYIVTRDLAMLNNDIIYNPCTFPKLCS